MPISSENFDYVRTMARDNAAIVLDPGKEYLVELRLEPLAVTSGFDSLDAMVKSMRDQRTLGDIHLKAIEALTTNETSFFRDLHPFDVMKKTLIPELIVRKSTSKTLNIWSGASSTGQEAYSISMLLLESFPELKDWKVKIIGTDLSNKAVQTAKEGIYSQFEVNRGLPLPMLARYFDKVDDGWQIKEAVRQMVDFRVMNLIKPWPFMARFDIVLMRNVLIYFDMDIKRQILGEIRKTIDPRGFLFLGSSETTLNIDGGWQANRIDRTMVYQLPNDELN